MHRAGPVQQTLSKKGSRPVQERLVRVGVIPLVDMAVLVVAAEEGFARREGIRLELIKDVSWSNIRDRLAFRQFDDLETESSGEGMRRFVVVYRKGDKHVPPVAAAPPFQRGGRGGRDSRGGGRGSASRPHRSRTTDGRRAATCPRPRARGAGPTSCATGRSSGCARWRSARRSAPSAARGARGAGRTR